MIIVVSKYPPCAVTAKYINVLNGGQIRMDEERHLRDTATAKMACYGNL